MMLAEFVTTGATSLDAAPYRLDRFADRQHGASSTSLILKGYDSL